MDKVFKKYWFVFGDIVWLGMFFFLMYLYDTSTKFPHMQVAYTIFVGISGVILGVSTLVIWINRLDDM